MFGLVVIVGLCSPSSARDNCVLFKVIISDICVRNLEGCAREGVETWDLGTWGTALILTRHVPGPFYARGARGIAKLQFTNSASLISIDK